MPESTGGDAPAAAAAPAAPGAELMSGKKSHNVRRHSCMRIVCREHFADISQKYFHFGEKHCCSHGCVTRPRADCAILQLSPMSLLTSFKNLLDI